MKHMLMTAAAVLATVALAAPAYAGQRHGGGAAGGGHAVSRPGGSIGHAVPRAAVPVRPPIVGPFRSYGHYPYPYYYPRFGLGLYYGYYGLGYPWYSYPYYGYGYGVPYHGYGYPGSITGAPAQVYGRVRIQNAPGDAQVFVDGDYVGIVDDIDAARTGLDLDAGVHHIEIRAAGFETIVVNVNLRGSRTITYRAELRPSQP